MPSDYDLVITADYPSRTAELRLLDQDGSEAASWQTDFNNIPAGRQHGLFDLRNYLRLFVQPGQEAASVADIGICIAEDVLGEEIFKRLWQSESQRTLRIQLPGATDEQNHLAAALARVPWEIARPAPDQATLGERNLLVRVVHDREAPATQPLELGDNESLRVLFVFAEARGSRPLAARVERQELRRLFEKEIYPGRRVQADFLTHGVTRERLESEIVDNGGYHIVHWSGHGHLNLLELSRPGGQPDRLSGEDLLAIFKKAGFFPRLFFLSACHSGDILRVKDWNDFQAVAEGKDPESISRNALASGSSSNIASVTEPGTNAPRLMPEEPATKQIELETQPGYTGTAHALLQGGVSSVVAMRYAVGDDYARDLGVEFYRAVLAHKQPKSVAAALTMARRSLLDPAKHDHARYAACDHVTPVLYGEADHGLPLPAGRSDSLESRNRRLHQIAELTLAGHEHFVGRTWELAGLGAEFIGSSTGAEVKPMAVITGLGGMGKTALVAEALSLWESRFGWLLLYQAKPNPLGFDATLRDIHLKLMGELGRYHKHVKDFPADAVYRDASEEFTGPQRLERLTRNLVRAMQDEPILLVLDNFETNLKKYDGSPKPSNTSGTASEGHPTGGSCQDPAWDDCLATLGSELVGGPSRVLITSRRPLAALADGASHPVLLGPLPAGEAALFLRSHPALSRLFFSAEPDERKLAQRLLAASRFHPLLMDRLARLADDPARRPQLLQALDALENTKDFAQLPALFATDPGDAKELAYLDDALATSLDQLIAEASPDARRLLWMIAVANEPVTLGLLRGVWSGDDQQTQQLRQIKQMLDILPQLPAELQERLKALPPEFQAMLDALPPESESVSRPEIEPLRRQLVSVGLVEQRDFLPLAKDDQNVLPLSKGELEGVFTCHELVRERIRAWMEQHSHDRAELTENAIRLAYAERLEAVYDALRQQNMTAALQAGSRAVVYCVQAEAWDRLGSFASSVVTGTSDPRLLDGLIPHLQTAAESAPEGNPRWSCLCYLADAIAGGGRPDVSLPFYEQAAAQARAAAETVSGTALAADVAGSASEPTPAAGAVPLSSASQQAWSDLAAISGNWANALGDCGDPDAARQRHLESAEAEKNAGRPAVNVIGSELEALRIDIMQGDVAAALPQVETRLAQAADWWQRQRSGQRVPEAPDAEILARAFISALDIARAADYARQDWESALRRLDATLEVQRALERPAEQIAVARFNRANVLVELPGRFGEARTELEACLEIRKDNPAAVARIISSLADLFTRQGDVAQAITQERRALALREQLPGTRLPSRSIETHRGRQESAMRVAVSEETRRVTSPEAQISARCLAATPWPRR